LEIKPIEKKWLKSYCSLELIDNKIVKHFHRNFPTHLDEEWLFHYYEFRNINSTPVKIYEVNDKSIVMDYVPGSTTAIQWIYKKGTSQGRLSKLSAHIHRLCADMLDYSEKHKKLFYHEDLNLSNFMIYDNKITLVDPESFIFGRSINYNALLQPHLNISKVAHKIFENTISQTKFY